MQDLINGIIFELCASGFVLLNIQRLLRDKHVAGTSPISVVFFSVWGIWNIYYYQTLNQPISAWACGVVTLLNAYWLTLVLHYHKKGKR